MVHHTYDLLGNPVRVYVSNKKSVLGYWKMIATKDATGWRRPFLWRIWHTCKFWRSCHQKHYFWPKSDLSYLIKREVEMYQKTLEPKPDIWFFMFVYGLVLALFAAIFLL